MSLSKLLILILEQNFLSRVISWSVCDHQRTKQAALIHPANRPSLDPPPTWLYNNNKHYNANTGYHCVSKFLWCVHYVAYKYCFSASSQTEMILFVHYHGLIIQNGIQTSKAHLCYTFELQTSIKSMHIISVSMQGKLNNI